MNLRSKRFVEANDINHIVNCAGYTAVDKAEEDKALCYRVNVEAVRNIANAASRQGKKVVHILPTMYSTDALIDLTTGRQR